MQGNDDRIMCVYWTDSAPVIDGKMDEAVWRQADVAKDFTAKDFGDPALKGWRATQQTEVRALYDAANLYLFWTMYEDRMDLLSPGIAEVERDRLGDWGDVPELFLDPGRSQRDYFQFACNAQAARFDMASKLGTGMAMRYTPDWECAVGRFEGGWTVAQRIPFGELALAGQLVGTPQVGDRWGINFCRNEGPLKERSLWAPTEEGFHEVKMFGNAVFKGRKDGSALPAVGKVDPGHLFYGPGALAFAISGATPPVKCRCVLSREGKVVEEQAGELPAKEGSIRIPYQLLDPGNLRFKFSLTSGGKAFYIGQVATLLPPTSGMLDEMAREIRAGKQTLARLGDAHPHFANLRKQADELDERVNSLRQQAARAKELTAEQWRTVVSASERFGAEWRKLQDAISLAGLYRGKAKEAPQLFTVGNGTESDEFYPDAVYRGSLTEPIRLSLAGNAYGAFQLAVIPFWQDLREVTVSFTPLKGPDGRRIPADQYRWSRKEYVQKENPNPPESYTLAYEPDEPGAPFAAPAGQVQVVWVDLRLPAGTPPGSYTGQVTVTANGQSVSRDVEVRASGIDIPKRSMIKLTMVKRTTLIKSEERNWFPRLHRMTNGTLVASSETAPDATATESTYEANYLRSVDDGATWREMESISKGKSGPCHITLRDGTYLQLWFYTVRRGDGWVTKVMRSTDNGLTYTTTDNVPVYIDNVKGGIEESTGNVLGMVFDHGLVEMDNGELLATMYAYFNGDRKYRSVLVKSTDQGQSWRYVSTIAYDANAPGHGFGEPGMIRTGPNRLLVLMRTGSEPGVTPMYQTVSADDGLTWSKPVPVAERGVEPAVILTKDGILVCSYGRPDVYAMYSPDGQGREWTGNQRIFHGGTTSYTNMVMTGPDTILLIHDARDHREKGDDKPYYYIFVVQLRIQRW